MSNATAILNYASLDDAVAAIGSNVTTLIIDTAMPAIANVTVPSTLTLQFTGTGSLSVPTGVTVTIDGPIQAPIQKIFSLTGTGVVQFGNRVEKLFPQWWGAIGDGVNNDQPAIQAALTASGLLHNASGSGAGASAYVFLPSGNYKLTAALKMPPASRLVGESMEGSQLFPAENINAIEILGTDWPGGMDFETRYRTSLSLSLVAPDSI